jgi:hypothetical protein
MAVKYSTGLISKLFGKNGTDAGADGIRGIMANGVIRIYSGAQPVDADSIPTGTLLGSITKDGAAFVEGVGTNGVNFGAPVGRTVSKSAAEVWKFTGVAAGTMGWFRYQANAVDDDSSSTSLSRIDGSVGVNTGDMRVTSVTSAIAAVATVDTFTITAAS